ncbi:MULTISPECIES: hypothetical protein [unclassified Streptomyces]|uniref:hypothetical protein n=1 Tax=unclassified Streptomyces TaxID=2593676 RepID=UPI0004C2174B|nr:MULTISPECIES: hypothetical protein [unclassified Streptomyces]
MKDVMPPRPPAHALLADGTTVGIRAVAPATKGAAVVVIGTRPRTGPVPRPGGLVHALLRRSHCPVLVVPGR